VLFVWHARYLVVCAPCSCYRMGQAPENSALVAGAASSHVTVALTFCMHALQTCILQPICNGSVDAWHALAPCVAVVSTMPAV
jgi:hypothetical protein